MAHHPEDDGQVDDFDEEDYVKSRSELKRDVQELQALGKALCKLPAAQLNKMNLPEDLRDAVADYQRFPTHHAKKRQLQYIGKVMRRVDPEPIKLAMDKTLHNDKQETIFLHRVERWRDRLLSDGDSVLGDLLSVAPNIDCQQLRQMVRNAQREIKANKPPKNTRLIFQYLKDQLQDRS